MKGALGLAEDDLNGGSSRGAFADWRRNGARTFHLLIFRTALNSVGRLSGDGLTFIFRIGRRCLLRQSDDGVAGTPEPQKTEPSSGTFLEWDKRLTLQILASKMERATRPKAIQIERRWVKPAH